MPHLLLLDGSLRGPGGNTAALLAEAARRVGDRAGAEVLHLATVHQATLEVALARADALLVGTGVYWGSWGSPLQRFLEVFTPLEQGEAFFGKPVGVAVTMDSVGGTDVAARLLAAFGGLGCVVPPCSSLVLSRVGQQALAATAGRPDDPNEDVWRLDDVDVVLDNLLHASTLDRSAWARWPIRALALTEGAWRPLGPVDLGAPRFVRG